MNYTQGQTQAITAERPEVLVSAAAGSGKTRVVTERVELLVRGADMDLFRREQRKTTRLDHMEDIRHMLLVTFTRAAASEMRTRIVSALNDAAASEPDPEAAERLREQAEVAAGSDITTLHGFCRKVIADHYEAAGVAAGFSLLNEAQAAYLCSTCAREVFDTLYEERSEDAQRLLARYGTAGDDQGLLNLVVSLHAQMMGKADPRAWLNQSVKETPAEMEKYLDELYVERKKQAARRLDDLRAVLSQMIAMEASGPMAACKTPKQDANALAELEEWQKMLAGGSVPELPKRGYVSVAHGEGNDMKPTETLRKKARSILDEAKALIAPPNREEDKSDLAHTQQDVRALVRIVERFDEKYTARKAASNRLDFSDLEHRALRVLREHGDEYAEKYRYIFVDEYQDTNPVQEAILAAIHLDAEGKPRNHQFLVGDMKQSIYGFRFADPTIFDGKSKTYALPAAADRSELIRMNDNFRSSPCVISGVNAVMGELMNENLGDVPYTEDEALVCGRQGSTEGVCRILLAEPVEAEAAGTAGKVNRAVSPEAEMIASQIERLHAAGRDYGDIAVLFRSRDDRLTNVVRALEARGIPAAAANGWSTLYVEIEVFLNLLRLVVNDRQDVPLLSVLRSFMFGFDERELAWIAEWESGEDAMLEAADSPRRTGPLAAAAGEVRLPFFRKLELFRAEAETANVPDKDRELHERVRGKIARFDQELASLRAEGADMGLDRFAEMAADRFSLPSYLLTRPNGSSRRRMYEQLLDVIRGLKQLHGNSLLRVLEAVDALREQGKLFGVGDKTVQVPGVVRLMTVHGSKGLEFPVVFLAGLDRNFTKRSAFDGALRSDRYGLTFRYVDEDAREKRDTLETATVKEYQRRQQLSEELRLLYVAMTRPQEELYLCGYTADREADAFRWEQVRQNPGAAQSPLDWIMAAQAALEMAGNPAAAMLEPAEDVQAPAVVSGSRAAAFDWRAFTGRIREQTEPAALLGLAPRVRIAAQQGISKLSEQDFAARKDWRRQRRPVQPVVEQETDITGARRGTLIHRFMRYAVSRNLDAHEALAAMQENRLVSAAEAEELEASLPQVQQFLESGLFARLRKASKVLTEQRFRLLVNAHEIDPQAPADAGKVRLRGMIDLAFLEEDGWVLVDYKTDRSDDAQTIVERYREQISRYSQALGEITGIPVKERHLYLLAQGKSVLVPA